MPEIKWLSWSREVFEQSKKEKKPVLLSISAVWCHWCHTMDKVTYANADIIKLVNQKFLPVRVDTDKRPDVNSRYNIGGWPSTVVLVPSGEVIAGATYLPPVEMEQFLLDALARFPKEMSKLLRKELFKTSEKTVHLRSLKSEMLQTIRDCFDPLYGGFGTEPKFPNCGVLDFLLFTREKDMLQKTLKKMCESPIYDSVEGGFYRYATRQDWSFPHYEKMLEDNAQLARTYLQAGVLFDSSRFKNVGKNTVLFVFKRLFDEKNNVFFASQDADEEFAHLKIHEREKRKLPFIDKTVYTDINCLMVEALLSASKVLGEKKFERTGVDGLRFLVKNLLTSYGARHCQGLDSPVLFRDSVFLLHALVSASSFSREFLEHARDLAVSIQTSFFDKESGGFFDVLPKNNIGYLAIRKKDVEDNSRAIESFVLLYRLTKSRSFLQTAQKTAQAILPSTDLKSPSNARFAIAVEKLLNVG